MEKKYTTDELSEAVDKFWEERAIYLNDGMSEYAATSIAYDDFIEKLGWEFQE